MDPEAGGSYQRGGSAGNTKGPFATPGAAPEAQPPNQQPLPGGSKIKELQNDVDQLTDVMKTNINKVLERGDTMETLNERSGLLTSRANEFRINSRTIRRKLWWQNLRFQIIIGAVLLTLVVIIIYWKAK